MKYSRPIPKPLLLILLLLWITCFGLTLNSAFSRIGYPPVIVKAAAEEDGFPTVVGFVSASLENESALRVGDQLIRFGGVELQGAGPVDFITHVAEETASSLRVPIVFEQSGKKLVETLVVDSYATYLPRLPASIVFIITAIILALRAKPTQMVRMFVWTHFCAAFLFAATFAGSWPVTYASIATHVISLTVAAPLAIRSVLLFPHGMPPKGWLARIAPWFFAVIGPLDASRIYLFPFSPEVGTSGLHIVSLIFIITFIIIITRTYRRSDPIGRRRLKWYLFGVYCAFSLPMAVGVAAILDSSFTQLAVISAGSLVFIPISHIISIMRYNFFDIDRIISVTASYTLLSIVLLAAILTAVPTLADELSRPIGIGPGAMQIGLSLILAVVVISLNSRLHPLINKVFFAERQALAVGIDRLLGALAACPSADQLTVRVGEQLDGLLRPESCAIYARGSKVFAPVFARGRAVPPAFEADSPLITTLEHRSTALSAETLSKSRNSSMLTPFDKAALETLGVPVVLPILRAKDLVAFVCLGPKRSGDVYTSTDLALLKTVADKVSAQLLSFDQTELIRQGREMQAALRRYVPEVIADQLESGHDLEVGECEVTVLFVDIRGYSSFAERRKVADVFSTVNRYTRNVSEIVQAQGGNVIEFNGDGMMAVFGAPQRLDHKERAAVKAGCKIVTAVGVLKLGDEGPQSSALSVGVGIATGEAFVGNVQAADRLFWTAIGTTTNLAARFQALTREMDASIVIDSATWNHTGDLAKKFEKRENTPIRGLSQTADLYVLPYRPHSSPPSV